MHKHSTNGLTSSGMCHCVTGWAVPDILKDRSTCIFRVKSKQLFHLWLCNPEDKGTTVLHNVWNNSPSDTMSHPRRPESSAILLWELHNLQLWQRSVFLWLCSPSPSQQSGILMTGYLKFQCCCRSNGNMGIFVWPNGSATDSQYCLLHVDSMVPLEGLSGPVCAQT